MELFIAISVLLVLLWVIYKLITNDINSKASTNVTTRSGLNSQNHHRTQIIDTGDLKALGENSYCLNIKSPFPITFANCSRSNANKLKRLLNGEASKWEKNTSTIAHLLAQDNITCDELEAYLRKAKRQISHFITNKLKSEEWSEASAEEKDELINQFQLEAVKSLECKPSNSRALDILLFNDPSEVSAEEELLELFSNNTVLYRFYVSRLGLIDHVIRASKTDFYRKHLESLEIAGLALRGREIPVEKIVQALKTGEINRIFSDRLEKRHTNKHEAVKWALTQPDLQDVLHYSVTFKDFFMMLEPEDIDITDIRDRYRYYYAQAQIIVDTYSTGYQTLVTLEDGKFAGYKAWEINSENCCPQCAKIRVHDRRPSKLPPFHIGCTCSLQGVYG